jgi:uncharacterized protein (TIGR02996 family)
MTDHDALLAAVLADPADDAPRRIYGDWLRERNGPGDWDRAEFIDVQCEIERTECGWCRPIYPCRAGGQCRKAPLQRREAELWERTDAHGAFLILPGKPFCAGHECLPTDGMATVNPGAESLPVFVIRRGFVAEVRCPLLTFAGIAAKLFRTHPITAVHLTDREPLGQRVWYDGGRPDRSGFHSVSDLPTRLFKLLDGGQLDPDGWVRVYPNAALARDALDRAAIAWGRELAGLPGRICR